MPNEELMLHFVPYVFSVEDMEIDNTSIYDENN